MVLPSARGRLRKEVFVGNTYRWWINFVLDDFRELPQFLEFYSCSWKFVWGGIPFFFLDSPKLIHSCID